MIDHYVQAFATVLLPQNILAMCLGGLWGLLAGAQSDLVAAGHRGLESTADQRAAMAGGIDRPGGSRPQIVRLAHGHHDARRRTVEPDRAVARQGFEQDGIRPHDAHLKGSHDREGERRLQEVDGVGKRLVGPLERWLYRVAGVRAG